MFESGCRNAPRAGVLLSRFRHQRTRHIVAISPPCFRGMTWCEPMASLIEELPDQRAARASYPSSLLWRSVTELVLHAVPCLAIENCLVLPGVAGALVRDLADVEGVRQQRIKRSAREWLPTGTGPIAVSTLLRSDPLLIEVLLQQSHRAKLPVSAQAESNRLGLLRDDDQLAIPGRITERGDPAHPHPLLLGGRDLVAAALAHDLALEL